MTGLDDIVLRPMRPEDLDRVLDLLREASLPRVLATAQQEALEAVYLLTETAADFFPRYGFRRIDRSEVAESVQTSAGFAELCPTSSVVMVRSCAVV